MLKKGYYSEHSAYKQAKSLLSEQQPTAIFVANDIMALGVIRACEELGISIPRDVSIVGYDNLEAADWLNLQLTTVSVDLEELAENSVRMILEDDVGAHAICKPFLIERGSVSSI